MLNELDINRPIPADYFNDIFFNIRNNKTIIKERLELDHNMDGVLDTSLATADGYHKKLTLPKSANNPDSMADANIFFTKEINGNIELCCRTASGVYQLTEAGWIKRSYTVSDVWSGKKTKRFPWQNDNYSLPNESIETYNFGGRIFTPSTNYLYYSDDAENWSVSNLAGMRHMAYGDGTYIAIQQVGYYGNRQISYSIDGINWSILAGQTDWTTHLSIAFGNHWFIITGFKDYIMVTDSLNTFTAYPTFDGVQNVEGNPNGTNQYIYSVVYGDGLFVGLAGATPPNNNLIYDKIYTSTDGVNWTLRTGGYTPRRWGRIFYAYHQFWVFYNNDDMRTSSDGISWTLQTKVFGQGNSSKLQFSIAHAQFNLSSTAYDLVTVVSRFNKDTEKYYIYYKVWSNSLDNPDQYGGTDWTLLYSTDRPEYSRISTLCKFQNTSNGAIQIFTMHHCNHDTNADDEIYKKSITLTKYAKIG